jgi:4-diphosphocytidyl-2-C-methyl-D-erythritol kinase
VAAAPAKLTLWLRVTGVRGDGYHLIDAEMVSLDLADELAFSEGSGLEVVEGHDLGFVDPHDNLVGRALVAVGLDAHVRLRKRIPAGGGLGGGSSNAAAVLRWAGCDDLDLAASLGADVPFCLRGGRARVTGIGEVLEPLPFVERTVTLSMPPFGCPTPAVYAAWDELGGPTADGPNDLEPAALRVEPRLARWRDELGDATGATPVLAGSGSTWFVEGAHPGAGRIVARAVPAYA